MWDAPDHCGPSCRPECVEAALDYALVLIAVLGNRADCCRYAEIQNINYKGMLICLTVPRALVTVFSTLVPSDRPETLSISLRR